MKHLFATIVLLSGFLFGNLAHAQANSAPANSTPEAVAVVIQITLLPGAKADSAATAMADMRAFIKKQPGFLSSELLTNVNSANSPAKVHVVRWAAVKYWESVFVSPEFTKLYAAGSKHYSISASAFKTEK